MSRGWQDVPLPEELAPQVMVWRWFAATYGWTPEQVENAPLEVQQWFPLIEEAANEAQARITKQEMSSARRPGGATSRR